jgi:hypothetical protein
MRFRRRRPDRDVGELRRGAQETDLGWDAELAEERGVESHESTDEGDRTPAPPVTRPPKR